MLVNENPVSTGTEPKPKRRAALRCASFNASTSTKELASPPSLEDSLLEKYKE